MDLGLTGRRALVCASTAGLGEAIARALAAEGADVVVTGRRGDRAQALAEELAAAGPGRAVAIEADLGEDGGAPRLHQAAAEQLGDIDVLVLNGPGPKPGLAAGATWAEARVALELLVRPQVELVEAALPGMRERGWGRVLAVGSSGVAAPLPNLAMSNLGRSALAGYLKTLAAEVAADGITVNMLLPGRIATDRVAQLDSATAERQGRTPEEVAADSRATIPAGRYGRPEEFGAVAAFLCGAPASYLTGTAIRCDGGLVRSL
jgi:3-oxoacyl-[acyl-carrier protein] reductase